MNFQELGLSEPLLRAVVSQGYDTPTPIQAQAIPSVIAGRDLLGCAQTGTGKTAAFALPILHRLLESIPESLDVPRFSGRTGPQRQPRDKFVASQTPRGRRRPLRVLVLAPTRELASQIGESFQTFSVHTGLRSAVIYGGVGQAPQTRALGQGVEILIATPGRLLDLMGQGFVDLRCVEIFVLDEADRMLDMGFVPDVRRVISALPRRRQTLLFSATMPTADRAPCRSDPRDPLHVRIAPVKATTELIDQSVYHVPRPNKPRLLARFLAQKAVTRALVFTRTKHGADRVVQQLGRSGIRADAIHGNKSQAAQRRSLEDFTH